MSNFASPSDINNDFVTPVGVESSETTEDKISRIIEQNKQKIYDSVKDEADRFQKYINLKQNPSAILVTLIVIAVVIIFYIFWRSIRPGITGKWYDTYGSVYIISDPFYVGGIIIEVGGVEYPAEFYEGYLIESPLWQGIWDKENTIYCTNGDKLKRFTHIAN